MYYVYMLRCIDNSLYTGITKDLNRRMKEHFEKTDKCAKYTRYHSAYKLETAWKTETKALASKLEYHIKKDLNKVQKEKLLKNPENINLFFDEKIDGEDFEVVEIGQRYCSPVHLSEKDPTGTENLGQNKNNIL